MEGCCGMMGGVRDGIRERCVVGNQSTETVG